MATELEQIQIDTDDLMIGMFVCQLDRPWEQAPFPLQGFEVRSDQEIDVLRKLCRHVWIDRRHEVSTRRQPLLTLNSADRNPARFKRVTDYARKTSVRDEVPRARAVLRKTSRLLARIHSDVASGRELSVEHVEEIVRPLVASVLRSADAFLFLEGMRQHNDYVYGHAISCGALAAAFGCHLGLPEETILSLTSGGLLMDVGKTRVPAALLDKPGPLTAEETEIVRQHVAHGLEIVAGGGVQDLDVLDVVGTHHERHDGSGYPYGLAGNEIPMAGRMLGIIDTYDAMTRSRPFRAAVARHSALQEIYHERDRLFQAELVEQFQVCLGVYPTGSQVELSSGELAVVMEQNHIRRLRPTVLVISTPDKQPLAEYRVFDLMRQRDAKIPVEIKRAVASGEYATDTAGFLAIS